MYQQMQIKNVINTCFISIYQRGLKNICCSTLNQLVKHLVDKVIYLSSSWIIGWFWLVLSSSTHCINITLRFSNVLTPFHCIFNNWELLMIIVVNILRECLNIKSFLSCQFLEQCVVLFHCGLPTHAIDTAIVECLNNRSVSNTSHTHYNVM